MQPAARVSLVIKVLSRLWSLVTFVALGNAFFVLSNTV